MEVLGDIVTVTHQFVGILAFRFHMRKLRDYRSGMGSGRPEYLELELPARDHQSCAPGLPAALRFLMFSVFTRS